MTWWTVAVALRGADPELVATALVQATGQAVEERGDSVVGVATDESAARRAVAELSARFGKAIHATEAPLEATDWSTRWREGLRVHRVGRLQVGPSWLLDPGETTVVIDPEMAFGSGEHGSTRGALALLDGSLRRGQRVLDLGSGSGVLAIGAAKLGAAQVLGIEIDDDAVPIAEQNAAVNQVADRVRFVVGDAALLAPLAGPVELVVSNILRTVNEAMLVPIGHALALGGVAIFAGMEAAEEPLFRAALGHHRFQVLDHLVDEGWWSVAATPQ